MWVSNVVAFIAEPNRALNLPLDVRGRPFSSGYGRRCKRFRRVQRAPTRQWRPRSVTRERRERWRQRAERTRSRRGAVPSSGAQHGGLGGYRWGIERKRELLKQESNASRKDV